MLGIGLAATRDIVSFFRHADQDDSGTDNPVRGKVSHVVAQGISQAGNFVRTFLHLGFNEDESGRIVWDGANAHIAARQLPINFRFARPGGAAGMYEPGSEGVLWWDDYEDRARGLQVGRPARPVPRLGHRARRCSRRSARPSSGACGCRRTWWGPPPTGTSRCRRPSAATTSPARPTGAGGAGSAAPRKASDRFELADNPNPQTETMRALLVALIDWVVKDTAPPPSRYPLFRAGQLVRPDHRAMGFPAIPGCPAPGQPAESVPGLRLRPGLPRHRPVGSDVAPAAGGPAGHPQPRPEGRCGRERGRRRPVGPAPGPAGHLRGLERRPRPGSSRATTRASPGASSRSRGRRRSDSVRATRDRPSKSATAITPGTSRRSRPPRSAGEAERFLLPDDAARLVREAEASDVLRDGGEGMTSRAPGDRVCGGLRGRPDGRRRAGRGHARRPRRSRRADLRGARRADPRPGPARPTGEPGPRLRPA